MRKTNHEHPADPHGTPSYVLISLLFAILLFALEGIKASIGLAGDPGTRLAHLAYIAKGLALAFFWRRLHESSFKTLNAWVFTGGLWIYLFLLTLIPLLLPRYDYLVEQVGLWGVVVSGLMLLFNLLAERKARTSSLATTLVGLLAGVASVWGLVRPPAYDSGEALLSSDRMHRSDERQGRGSDGEEIHASAFAGDPGASELDGNSVEPDTRAEDTADIESRSSRIQTDSIRMKLAARQLDEREEPVPEGADDTEIQDESYRPESKAHAAKPKSQANKSSGPKASQAERTGKIAKNSHPKASVHWEYSGARGPQAWGRLSPEFRLCEEGLEQSPIDIPSAWPLSNEIELLYEPSTFEVIDNGHTVQFKVEPGNFALMQQKRYELKQIHFHTPSEHLVDGRSAILEAHFVHASARGELAVIGTFVEAGSKHRTYEQMWDYLPFKKHETIRPLGVKLDLRNLLPQNLSAYTYPGSLTTPPCTEKVSWYVLRDPVRLSQEQIQKFRSKYRLNARPVQELHQRGP